VRTILLPPAPGRLALWLEPGGGEFAEYRATLFRADGGTAWRGDGLVLNELGAAVLTFHTSTLTPGDYELLVEGLSPGGEAVRVAGFRLRFQSAS
jgi:hypothetical protein